MIKSKTL